MSNLINEIVEFLKNSGFDCSIQTDSDLAVICTRALDGHHNKVILPLEVTATSYEDALEHALQAHHSIRQFHSEHEEYPLIITLDRWRTQTEMMKARILAHLEVFSPIYARNCEVRKIDRTQAKEFLELHHSYGYAACKYCYGLFFKRHTGHIAMNAIPYEPGTLMAVATFSNARKWTKGDQVIRSYEWTRYASLPQVRLSGGMGRLLKIFIKEVQPDDIMSYADLEWSTGEVYRQLGFELEGQKSPVTFTIDKQTWKRVPLTTRTTGDASPKVPTHSQDLYFQNFGSNKYRLKLTDYK